MLGRKKWKSEEKKQEEERQAWFQMAMYSQGTSHLNREPEPTPDKTSMETTSKEEPPPYEKSGPKPTTPPASLYPILQVTSGMFQVETAPAPGPQLLMSHIGDPTSPPPPSRVGIPAHKNRDSKPQKEEGFQVDPEESSRTTDEEEEEEPEPFQDRKDRERQGAKTKKKIRVRKREDKGKRQPKGQTGRVKVLGHVSGHWEKEPDGNVEVFGHVSGHWESEGNLENEEEETKEEKASRLLDEAQHQMAEAERLLTSTGKHETGLHAMQLRGRKTHQMPLIQIGGGLGDRYKALSLGDVQALVDQMPPPAEGGSLWLSKLDRLTAGQTLALGDFRAVAARCMTSQDLRDIEQGAQTQP